MTQIKGDGEAHPFLSPNDEFADYGTWDKGNLNLSELKKDEMLQYEYARSALQLGLKLEKKLGTNPFKFGMIGSTDSHTSLATADDDNFFGKHSGSEPSPSAWSTRSPSSATRRSMAGRRSPPATQAVWATREHPRGALRRHGAHARPTRPPGHACWCASSADGTSWLPTPTRANRQLSATGRAYRWAETSAVLPPGKSPSFLVAALKDPIGANLDRVQIIKGWVDANGERQERVYDVAVSDGREIGADGRCKDAGGGYTVDVANATWSNSIGATELITVWKDPDFDPSLKRLLLRPRARDPDPALDCLRRQVLRPRARTRRSTVKHQERAYTSPIWYTP